MESIEDTIYRTLLVSLFALGAFGVTTLWLQDKIVSSEKAYKFNTTMAKLVVLNKDIEKIVKIVEKRKR